MGERLQREKEERARREAEEAAKKEAEEARKKAAIANMSMHYGGYLGRDRQRGGGNRRQTAREEKRKPLNIDHLNTEKLREKAKDLHSSMKQLEEEKYDLEVTQVRQKYDISQLRTRVSDFMQ